MFAEYKAVINCLLFVSSQPVTSNDLAKWSNLDPDVVEFIIEQLKESYHRENLGIDIIKIEDGWQLCTKPEYAQYVEKVIPSRSRGLSLAALETLSIIAYRQPVTRMEIEEIRGVKVDGVLQTLLERELIEEKGRKDAPGKPILYGTTTEFLRSFKLKSLDDLPQLPR